MKIEKIAHSCIVVEESGVRFIFDPGSFSKEASNVSQIDYMIITHEHSDHFDLETIKIIIENNAGLKILTNSSVKNLLADAGIKCDVLESGDSRDCNGVKVEAFGDKHEEIYETIPQVQNTGYLIAEKFYHPGDAYHVIDKKIEVLALPLGSPWGKVGESMDFAKEQKPKKCFPIHDGLLTHLGPYGFVSNKTLTPEGIEFIALKAGEKINL